MQVEKGKVMDNNPVESFAIVILSKWYVFHVNFREQKHTHTHTHLSPFTVYDQAKQLKRYLNYIFFST